jgi:hypothetical protein
VRRKYAEDEGGKYLFREVVVEVGNDLHGHIGLTGTGGSDHRRKPRIDSRPDRLHLNMRERDGVLFRDVLGVGSRVRRHVGLDG